MQLVRNGLLVLSHKCLSTVLLALFLPWGSSRTAPLCLSCCAGVVQINSNSYGLYLQISAFLTTIILYTCTLYLYICISAGDSRTSRFG